MQLNSKPYFDFSFPARNARNFHLLHGSTICFVLDNALHHLETLTGKSTIYHHPEGRTYQSLTTSPKHDLIVLADYGRACTLYFQIAGNSFSVPAICPLDLLQMELSLDTTYLAVVCGSPTFQLLLIDTRRKLVLNGEHSRISLKQEVDQLIQIQFNPSSKNELILLFKHKIEIYHITECIEATKTIQDTVSIIKTHTLPVSQLNTVQFRTMLCDEISNVYISHSLGVTVYSLETKQVIITYLLNKTAKEVHSPHHHHKDEHRAPTSNQSAPISLALTLRHVILFYPSGRIEWLLKYYPDLMEEEERKRPLALDKFHNSKFPITHAVYSHHFTHLILSHTNGYFSTLQIPAETNQIDEEDEAQGKQVNQHEITQEAHLIGPYHCAPILLIRQIEGTSQCVTVSQEGKIIMWSLAQRKSLVHHSLDCAVDTCDMNAGNNVLAVGLRAGVVRFYSVGDVRNVFMFKWFRLVREGSKPTVASPTLSHCKFSSNGGELCIYSPIQKRIYFLLTLPTHTYQVLGYVSLALDVADLCWNPTPKSLRPNYEFLLLSVPQGILMLNSPNAVSTKRRGKELELQCELYGFRTDGDRDTLMVLPSGDILAGGQGYRRYKQPEEIINKMDFRRIAHGVSLEEISGHELEIVAIGGGYGGIVSGSLDGSIHLRDFQGKLQRVEKMHGWKQQSLAFVARSSDYAFSGGMDGSVKILHLKEKTEEIKGEAKISEVSFPAVPVGDESKYYEDTIEEDYLQKMKDIVLAKKKVQFQKLKKIKEGLASLLEENSKQDEMQQLSRDEFAIDLESREIVSKQGKEKCEKIREQSRRKILREEVHAIKLREITWDRMEVQLKAINGLKLNYLVYNFQMRKMSKDQKRMVQLVFSLRKNQKKQGMGLIPPNKNIVNGGVIQPLVLTIWEVKNEKKEEKGKKKKEEEVVALVETEEIFNQGEWGLLYSAFELFTQNARRNQIILMQHMIIRIKEAFNREFEKIVKLRQNQNELINDKNKRIVEICEQLKRPNQSLVPRPNLLDSFESLLSVTPEDIPFKKHLSREQREKLERERVREEERQKKLAEDDASQRALQKMMGGTLAEKKTSVLEMNVEREKWMDKPLQDMSEEERAKMKDYEQRKLKNEEEKERIVKKLEAELRKLRQQIDEIMEKYDDKLFTLARRKIEYDYRIEEQQLYCARLQLSIVASQVCLTKIAGLQGAISRRKEALRRLEEKKSSLKAYESEIEAGKDAKKVDNRRLGEMESKIKTIEKSIFEQYHSNPKKRREMEEKLLESEAKYKETLISLDPFREIQSRNLSNLKEKDFNFFLSEIRVLQQTYDIPEASLFQILEGRFNGRREEIEYEIRAKVLSDSIGRVALEMEQNERELRSEQTEREELLGEAGQSRSDVEVQVRLRQGQVELGVEKPIMNLEEALLLNRAEIQEKNVRIMTNADQKIKVMSEIKTCKIQVTEETLNMEKKQELIEHLNTMIKDIQMLKVKKQMQKALSKKDSKPNQHQLKSLKEQIEKVKKEGEKRLALFQTKIGKVGGEIESLKRENKQLETQKWTLESTMKQREKIKEMMCAQNGEGDSEAGEKFEQIAVNRKLFDKAKEQTEQIELLREELSKLKAKTFANFSNVQK